MLRIFGVFGHQQALLVLRLLRHFVIEFPVVILVEQFIGTFFDPLFQNVARRKAHRLLVDPPEIIQRLDADQLLSDIVTFAAGQVIIDRSQIGGCCPTVSARLENTRIFQLVPGIFEIADDLGVYPFQVVAGRRRTDSRRIVDGNAAERLRQMQVKEPPQEARLGFVGRAPLGSQIVLAFQLFDKRIAARNAAKKQNPEVANLRIVGLIRTSQQVVKRTCRSRIAHNLVTAPLQHIDQSVIIRHLRRVDHAVTTAQCLPEVVFGFEERLRRSGRIRILSQKIVDAGR